MKQILIFTVLANFVLLVGAYFVLPDRMITHHGPDGPDGWSSKEFFTLAFIGIEILFFSLFYFLPNRLTKLPAKFTNLPNKEYWSREENLDEFHSKVGHMLAEIGIVILLVVFFSVLDTINNNLDQPLLGVKTPGVVTVVLLSWIYGAFWMWKLRKTFTVPD